MDSELVTVNTTEGGAFGAALLAGVGLWNMGKRSGSVRCHDPYRCPDRTQQATVAAYNDLYPLYRELVSGLKPTFDAVAE